MHRLAIAFAVAAVLLGAAHIALGTVLYKSWTIDAAWFVGTGLAFVVAGAANLLALDRTTRRDRLVLAAVNLVMIAYFAAVWLVLRGPQVLVGGALFAGLLLSVLTPRGQRTAPPPAAG